MKNWRRAILYGAVAGIEGGWLYVLLSLINEKAAGRQLSVLGLLLIYPIAFFLNQLLLWAGWHKFFRNVINLFAWAIVPLLMIKVQLFSNLVLSDTAWLLALPRAITNIFRTFAPELWLLIGSVVVWWLGRRLAQTYNTFTTLVAEFQFGLVALLTLFFVASALETNLPDSLPVTLTFFLVSLLGIAIAHAEEGESWLNRLRQGHWLGLLLISIGLILILGLFAGSVITPDFLHLIVNGLKLAWNFVWGLIFKVILFIASLFPEPEPLIEPPDMSLTPLDETGGFKVWELFPEWFTKGIRLAWSILMIGILVFALWRIASQMFAWLRKRLADKAEAEYEPMSGAFTADILSFLKRILFRLLGLKLLRRQKKAEPPEISSIRQIYRQLLGWATAQGYPRLAFQTPYEYLYTLEALLPASRDSLGFITQHYVSARYGLASPSEAELHQLKASWHQVKQNRLRPPETG